MLAAMLALLGCAQPDRAPEAPSSAGLPEEIYAEAARRGGAVYRVRPEESILLVRVGRAGTLKNLGHDHIVASEDIGGLVLISDDPAVSRADLSIPLQTLLVDAPEYRRQAALDPDVPQSAIDGTSRNMQDKVLESAIYPWARVSARFASAKSEPTLLAVSVTLHGVGFEYLVPVELQVDADRLVVAGQMSIGHEDFGLTAYSAGGGLLRVAEQLDLEFTIVAYGSNSYNSESYE